ncbi:MAG: hypothetical protein IJU99_09355 [Lachnospiraceae bacterium]|jgi:cell division protein FtsL|nr:hypothetical protein [Lachnospiraceae bacterium]MBR0152403.1 hypothetical protein [Lachnospiraceae bacterium]
MSTYNVNSYMNGSAARTLAPQRDIHRNIYQERIERRERIEREQRAKEEEERLLAEAEAESLARAERSLARNLDLFSLVILVAAIAITIYTMVSFLTVNSDVTNMSKQVVALEKEIIDMENINEAALAKANASVDLAEVYRIATEELGMVHASKNRVITYESTQSDFVRQYAGIPTSESAGLLDRIIAGVKSFYGKNN